MANTLSRTLTDSLECAQKALVVVQKIGDIYIEGYSLVALGKVQYAMGQHERVFLLYHIHSIFYSILFFHTFNSIYKARATFNEAVELARKHSNRRMEALATVTLGKSISEKDPAKV